MKYEELQYERLGDANETYPASTLVIRKQFVDAAIEELKAKLDDVQATAYAESVDAGMENRRLKRALYKACANWADVVAFEETEGIGHDNSVAERWRKMESKCLKKAEESK